MNDNEQGNSALGLIAGAGWALSILLIIYGIYFYGPNQFEAGVTSGTNPASPTVDTLPDGSPVQIEADLAIGALGTIQQLTDTGILFETISPTNPDQTRTLSIRITPETQIMSRQFISAAPDSIDAEDEIVGGVVEEVEIQKGDLLVGDEVEVRYYGSEGDYQAESIFRG